MFPLGPARQRDAAPMSRSWAKLRPPRVVTVSRANAFLWALPVLSALAGLEVTTGK